MTGHARLLVWVMAGVALSIPPCAAAHEDARGRGARQVTDSDLRSLIYDDNVPGFRKRPKVDGSVGPFISRNELRNSAGISGTWVSGDGLTHLHIAVWVSAEPEDALGTADRHMYGCTAALIEDSGGDRIGARSWYSITRRTAILIFVSGRVVVSFNLVGVNRREPGAMDATIRSEMDAHLEEVARTLARGLEWVIRQHPDMMAQTAEGQKWTVLASGKPVSAPALTFGKVAWTSLSAFEHAGAKVTWDAKAGKATVSYGGKTVELTALRREARVNGRKLDLGFGVVVDRFGPVVPVRKLAEALGMKVTVTKTKIELG